MTGLKSKIGKSLNKTSIMKLNHIIMHNNNHVGSPKANQRFRILL